MARTLTTLKVLNFLKPFSLIRLIASSLLLISFLFSSTTFANAEAVQSFTYEGRLYDDSGNPLAESVAFRIQILNSASDCVLYEERQTFNLSSSKGRFALEVGSDVGAGKRTGDDPGFAMWQVFKNTGSLAVPAAGCPGTPFNPALGEKRKLRVFVDPASGPEEKLSPDQNITSAPSSLMSQSLQGIGADGFVQITGNITQSNLDDLASEHSDLMDLAAGTSSLYMAAGSSVTTDDVFASDQMAIGTVTPAAGVELEIQNNDPTLRLEATDGGTGNMAIQFFDTAGTDQAQIMSTEGTAGLTFSTGGSSALVLDASQNAQFQASMTVAGTIQGGVYDNASETGTLLPALTTCGAGCAGTQWMNSDLSLLRYWDGAAVRSVGSFNGAEVAGRALISNGPGNAPTFQVIDDTTKLSLDGSDTMAGDLNMGSNEITNLGSPVSAGDAVNKSYADGNLAGESLGAPGAAENGQAIRWNEGAGNWEYFTPNAGTVSGVSATAPLASSGGATPDISLNFADGLTNNGGNLEVNLSSDLTFSTGQVAIATDGVTSTHILDGTISNIDIDASADIARTKLADGTANMVLVNDGTGAMSESATIDATELGQLNNVSSNIQTQLDGKQASLGFTPVDKAGDTMTGALGVNAAVTITGSADAVQLSAQAQAAQTANLFELKNSAGTAIFTVQADGSISAATDIANKNYVDTAIAGITDNDTTYTADGNGIELSGTTFNIELDGNTLSKSATGLKVEEGNLDITALSGYDANDNVDHTSVTLTAGDGLTGTGDISASRTFNVVGGDGIVANADDIAVDLDTDPGLEFNTGALRVKTGAGLSRDSTGVFHTDTSSVADSDNSNGVILQDITFDTFGHVQTVGTTDLDSRYYTETESDSSFVDASGDSMSGPLTMNTQSEIRLSDDDDSDYISLKAPTGTTQYDLTLPNAVGNANDVLQTDASGNLSWVAIPSAPVTDVFGRVGNVVAQSGDYNAGQITSSVTGNVSATNVQAAITELDTEKVATTRNVNTPAAGGLTGGGDLSSDRSLSIDITGMTATSTQNAGDEILIFSGADTAMRKMSRSDFIAGIDTDTDTTYTADGEGIEVASEEFSLELDGTTLSKSATGLKVNAIGSTEITNDTITNDDINSSAAVARTKLASGTANMVLINDGTGAMSESATIDSTELGHLNGVSSNIQTQLDGKQASLGYTPVDVAGDTMTGALDMGAGAAQLSTTDSEATPAFTFQDDTNTGIFSPAADEIAISTAGSEALRIGSTGNVGIGITNPSQKLDVVGGAIFGQSTASNTAVFGPGGDLTIQTSTAAAMLKVYNGSTNGLTVTPNTGSLQMNGPGISTGFLYNGAVADGASAVLLTVDSKNSLSNASSKLLSIRNQGSEKLTVLGSGNVGIGTSSPGQKFHVLGSINDRVASQVENTDSGTNATARFSAVSDAGDSMFGITSSGYTSVTGAQDAVLINGNNTSGGIVFSLDGVSQMKIDSAGNIGIGTTTPDTPLHVAGGIKIGTMAAGDCDAVGEAGRIRYNAGDLDYCDGSSWQTLGTAAGGEINTAANVGTGTGLFRNKTGSTINLKSINAEAGGEISITNNANDITLDVVEGNLDITAIGGYDANDNVDHTSVTLTAGDGLTGTGDISADRTFNVVGGDGIVANADDIAVDLDTDPGLEFNTGALRVKTGAGLSRDSTGIFHTDTSSVADSDNSNGVILQDITFDTFGHVQTVATTDLDSRYYTETESDSTFVDASGDSMTGALAITGSSDAVQLSVQADAAQTANLFELKDSSGTPIYTVQADGTISAGTDVVTKSYFDANDSSGLANVVDDTTPQLGGNLDVNGNSITSTGALPITTGSAAGNDFTVNTNTLVVEGDTGHVGIGTDAPLGLLHVEDNAATPTLRVEMSGDTSATRSTNIDFAHSNGAGARIQASRQSGDTDGMNLKFFTEPVGGSLVEALRISSDGNVGIGTTIPNAKLTVEGVMTLDQQGSDPTGTAGYGSLYTKTDGSLYYRNGTGTVTDLLAGGGGGSPAGASGQFQFNDSSSFGATDGLSYSREVNGQTTISIYAPSDNSGSQGAILDIVGDRDSDNGSQIRFDRIWSLQSNGINGTTGSLSIFKNLGTFAAPSYSGQALLSLSTSSGVSIIDNNSSVNGALFVQNTGSGAVFRVNDDASDTSPFLIDASGNVGIGTTSPNAKLTVEGAMTLDQLGADPTGTAGYGSLYTKADGSLYYRDGTGTVTDLLAGGGGSPGGSDTQIQFNNSGSFAGAVGLTWDSTNERLGVGATSSSKFTVGTSTTLTQSTVANSNASGMAIHDLTSNGRNLMMVSNSSAITLAGVSPSTTGISATSPFVVATNNSERLRIDASGNVGIGTATPNSKLTVEGVMTLDQQASDPTGTGGYGSLYTKTDGSLYYRDGTGTVTDLLAAGGGTGDFKADGTVAMTGQLRGSPGSAVSPGISFSTDTDTGIRPSSANQLAISTGGSDRVIIDSSLLQAPNLIVTSNNLGGFNLVGTFGPTASNPTYSFGGDTNTGMFRADADEIGFSTAGSEVMRIDSSGNVGIGTTSPSNALHIEGTTYAASEVRQVTHQNSILGAPELTLGKTRGSDTTIIQDGDRLGFISFKGSDGVDVESVSASIEGLVDGTPGADDMPGALRFMTSADGSAAPTERVRIDSTGKVGIGTASPTEALEVNGKTKTTEVVLSSDRNYKREIATINHALDEVLKIRGVSYFWRQDEFPEKKFTSAKQFGVIAQEVREIFPHLVNGEDGDLSVNYQGLIAPLIEALREMNQKVENKSLMSDHQARAIEDIRRDIASIKAENKDLRNTVEQQNQKIEKMQEQIEFLMKKMGANN